MTRQRTCLLVDDLEAVRDTTATILDHFGYKVVTVSNGSEAVRMIEAQSGGFDLIITDILMPISDGFELVNRLNKLLESGENRPTIIGYSGGGVQINVDIYKKLAETLFDFFIEKPFTVPELREAIDTAHKRREHKR